MERRRRVIRGIDLAASLAQLGIAIAGSDRGDTAQSIAAVGVLRLALKDFAAARQAAKSAAGSAGARLLAAQSLVAGAQLNLDRTKVLGPQDGYVVNLNVHPGDSAVVGRPLIAVVDRHSFRIEACFEETKLPHLHRGDVAELSLLVEGLALASGMTCTDVIRPPLLTPVNRLPRPF